MIAIVTGCTAERANEILAQLDRRGGIILDPRKGEDVQLIGGFTVRNTSRKARTFAVEDSDGHTLLTMRAWRKLRPKRSERIIMMTGDRERYDAYQEREHRRKLRRIGGSDRLWRALRGGR